MQIKFIPLDYDYFDLGNESFIRVWGKDSVGKRVCLLDSCDDFFWVIPKQDLAAHKLDKLVERIKGIKEENACRQVYVKRVELHKKNYLGKEVKALKLIVSNHKDKHFIGEIVKQLPGVDMKREMDIPFVTRYIIEKKVLPLHWYSVEVDVVVGEEFGGMAEVIDVDLIGKIKKIQPSEQLPFEPKAMAFDIEVDSLEIGKGEILMISLVGESGKFKKVLTWKKVKNLGKSVSYVEFCKDEADMLEKFCEYVKEKRPDVLVGYFSDGFDMPYLRARAEAHKVKLALGLDGSQPVFARGRISSAKVTGLVHVDLFRFIETVYSQYLQSETLSLNEVAGELLGERKHEFGKNHAGQKADGLKEHDWREYFAYNLQDSVLTEKLFHKLWPDLLEFTRVTQEPLFNVSRDSFSQHVENYIIHNLQRFNEIAEHRPTHEQIQDRRSRERYGGAFVLQPQAALYENLAVFDFTSLYPSIIVSFNISGASLVGDRGKAIKDAFKIDDVELAGKKQTIYFSKKPSFIPVLLGEVIKKRKEIKKQFKVRPSALLQARSNAFKTLANATYGYFGFFGARYYCVEAAASTAALGRKFIHEMIDRTNKAGLDVIYADTDSLAFSLGKKGKKDVLGFLEKLNADLPGMMELELEDFYKRGIFVTKRTGEFGAKKKYALLNEKDQLKVRGFETVRRDWCNLAREVQNKILKKILHEGRAESALKYVRGIVNDIRKRKVAKEELIIRTQLKKPISEYVAEGPHVTIAKKMVAAGMPVDVGMLIEFYIAEPTSTTGRKKKQLIRERARLPDESAKYDVNYYLNNQIIPAVENIFAVFGISKDEVIAGKKQKKLMEF